MKATELRIGNYLFAKGIEVIRFTSFFGLCNIESYPERYSPIPLDEEWLKKLGFKYSEERESMSNGFEEWYNGTLYLGYMHNCYIFDVLDQGCINMPITHVHQLQNLYFALTGEELTIN
jgi:hypothetical protein